MLVVVQGVIGVNAEAEFGNVAGFHEPEVAVVGGGGVIGRQGIADLAKGLAVIACTLPIFAIGNTREGFDGLGDFQGFVFGDRELAGLTVAGGGEFHEEVRNVIRSLLNEVAVGSAAIILAAWEIGIPVSVFAGFHGLDGGGVFELALEILLFLFVELGFEEFRDVLDVVAVKKRL